MPRAGRPVMRRVSAVWRAASLISAARWIAARRRFGAAQVRRADLDHRRAERERRLDAGAVGDAAGGDHRHAHAQRTICGSKANVPHCRRQVVGEEVAAMAAGLEPLRDHRVDAARFEPERLVDRRRAGQDARAGRANAIEQRRARAGRSGSSRPPAAAPRRARRSSASNGIACRQPTGTAGCRGRARGSRARARCRHAASRAGVGDRRPVAEEVEVERRAASAARIARDLAPDRRRRRASRTAASRGRRRCRRRSPARSTLHAGHRRLDHGQLDAEDPMQLHALPPFS